MLDDSTKHNDLFEQFKAASGIRNNALAEYSAYKKNPIRDPKIENELLRQWFEADALTTELSNKLESLRVEKEST